MAINITNTDTRYDDTHPNNAHPNDTHPNDTHPKDTHPNETHLNDTHPNDTQPIETHHNTDTRYDDRTIALALIITNTDIKYNDTQRNQQYHSQHNNTCPNDNQHNKH